MIEYFHMQQFVLHGNCGLKKFLKQCVDDVQQVQDAYLKHFPTYNKSVADESLKNM